ncbi:hypothetical protein SOASR030_03680 [Leminorella grimontii]|uniref:HTH tetR-type domain-containing protein n=1 Tax=Leminorella grimontii TaxID=82981 RepID=A0AAV5N0G9_9GAMM|nr:TetR/AcrR family transcriptional regulator [Leminorella grimontii]KFC96547.1 TetR family transcriptional regulator [Leminorella grimontii ATCC 33999 = DSM 5078]GKX54256.1 hypothetical protein SOASR030_03680 [Leminorella grimontii]GKX57697.1 hypothetical protein SOASR031_00120 [Leminorella grimontii]VFS59663.1 Probable acrEF/envCD operon repressor [Leminorella grimontii]
MARPNKSEQINITKCSIEATLRLLDTHEASTITLAQVAEEVGCKAPALYNHFSNKDALMYAVQQKGFQILLSEKLRIAVSNQQRPLERLREGGKAYLRFAFAYPNLYRLMFSPTTFSESAQNPFDTPLGSECLETLRIAVQACQEQGYLKDRDAGHIAFTLWSAIHGCAWLILQGQAPLLSEKDVECEALALVDTMMSFIHTLRPNA